MYWRLRQEWIKTARHIPLFPTDFRDGLAHIRVKHHHEIDALTVTGTGPATANVDDTFDCFAINGLAAVVALHSAAAYDFIKLHDSTAP